ncbi:MAG: dienelactone hydrolase family protein [Chitinophagaceae bacterium]
MKSFRIFFTICALAIAMYACNNQPASTSEKAAPADTTALPMKIKEENVSYNVAGDSTMNSFIAYDESSTKKRPAILIIPEWWGLTDYARSRAKQLAALGYIAMAVDMYGFGKTAPTPDSAMKLSGPFYKDPHIAKMRFDGALEKIKTYAQTDTRNIAAIGYCFGGAQVLNLARLGEDLKGVVSFHGNLIGVPANKDLLKAKILVCHGEADQFVKPAELAAFKKQMDSIKADYTVKTYPGAMHAFTNPEATSLGEKFKLPIAYNGAADTASWKEMQVFFDKIFK